jgi:hypothetical protein
MNTLPLTSPKLPSPQFGNVASSIASNPRVQALGYGTMAAGQTALVVAPAVADQVANAPSSNVIPLAGFGLALALGMAGLSKFLFRK